MDHEELVNELEGQLNRINQALAALKGRSRQKRGRRKFSATARKRMAEARRRWWADRKKK